jgi:hypothetical protein
MFQRSQRSIIIPFRVSLEEQEVVEQLMVACRVTSKADLFRLALDQLAASKGVSVSGSKTVPAASTANVKAASKRSPSKKKGRTQ